MKFPSYNHAELEEQILTFWRNKKIVEKLRERDSGNQKFYFLQGPPYTSGKVHLGTAWNMAMKDLVLRYKRMHGLDVWDRMGYDMHGLPTETKVMKKFELKDKEDILDFGLAKFMEECEKFCKEMMATMNDDFMKLGATLDFTDPYQPITQQFMEAEWWLIKKVYSKGRLYEGLRTMHWDAATQSSVAKHELEYKNIKDTSIFVKFKVDEKKYIIIWTTTPWTIPLNLAVMVNPELDYVDVLVGEETWIVAKSLVESIMEKAKVDDFTVVKEFKGTELEGIKYEHPLGIKEFLPQELQDNPKLFSILLTKEYCDDSAGTGLVHCAPGCGPEDYEVGHENGIPPFNCVNEAGLFENFGQFSGWKAKSDDVKFIQSINDTDALVAKESYRHDYPHGERSHEPVIFRTTKQWFFKVEDLKNEMIAANNDIKWVPHAAYNAFNSWLENLRDNSITKQRYWGTPVPIWQAKDGSVIVVESVAELEELSGQKVENMHIPHIDTIIIKKDGKTYTRISDVLDVWIDAGTTSWNCLNYPSTKKDFERLFPADFILEGKDQIRGWFNLLMVSSFLAFEKPSFKNVYMHGFLNDVGGVKMSKSLGNIIAPDTLIQKHGADVLRYYMSQTNAGEDMNFSWEECVVKQRNLHIMWNVHNLLMTHCTDNDINPFTLEKAGMHFGFEEKYMISKLHSTINEVTTLMEDYKLDEIIRPLEELFLELSRTYIQMVRDKMNLGSKEEKQVVAYTIGTVLFEGIKMFQIVTPFICEAMYLNLKEQFSLKEESVSHFVWPEHNPMLIEIEVEEQMELAGNVIQAGLNTREKIKRGLRWPVKEYLVQSSSESVRRNVEKVKRILMRQLNAKELRVVDSVDNMNVAIKPVHKAMGPVFGGRTQDVIARLLGMKASVIVERIEKTGNYTLAMSDDSMSDDEVTITKEMIEIERSFPEEYTAASFKQGFMLLDSTLTPELEAEGYAREVTRNIQQLRKNVGLQKTDRVTISISSKKELHGMLMGYVAEISEKVGADELSFTTDAVEGEECKVKGQVFKVKMEQV